jgi:alkylation response protein AidB-like acyl-CoA dehydrogenase
VLQLRHREGNGTSPGLNVTGVRSVRAEGDAPSHALVAAAHSLGPQIARAADRIEAERQLPAELVDGLIDARLFRMLLPAAYGGCELDLPSFARAIEALACADGSVAWCVGQANGLCNYVAYLDPAAAASVFSDPHAILANGPGEGNRPGRAVACDGGYRVTGRWMFASGIGHATWLIAACHLYPSGSSPASRLMLVPKSAATLHDVWHVSGLRGTGSHSFSLDDVFVPASHVIHFAPEGRKQRGPLYLFTNNGMFGPAFGSVALGLARASLSAIVDFAAEKVPRGYERSIRESTTVQAAIAQAHARLGAARAYLFNTLDEVWDNVSRNGELRVDQQVAARLASTHATQESAAVVDISYSLAGSNAIFQDRPFERRFRDMHAVTQQLQGRRAHYEHVGAYLLGLEPQTAFL